MKRNILCWADRPSTKLQYLAHVNDATLCILAHTSMMVSWPRHTPRQNPGRVGYFAFYSPILALMSRYTKANHSVYMTFFFRSGWQVQFLEADLKTPLPSPLSILRRSGSWHGVYERDGQVFFGEQTCNRDKWWQCPRREEFLKEFPRQARSSTWEGWKTLIETGTA
jgi:hypothetical protein